MCKNFKDTISWEENHISVFVSLSRELYFKLLGYTKQVVGLITWASGFLVNEFLFWQVFHLKDILQPQKGSFDGIIFVEIKIK